MNAPCRFARHAGIAALCTALLLPRPVPVDAACNLIPPAEQAFPSTTGSVTSPITTVGFPVEIRLTACDGSAGFDPTPANNQVAITFTPAGPGQPAPILVPGGSILVSECAASCNRLRFTMPSTPGLAGPAAIAVTVGATLVADVGPLFQAHPVGSTCDKMPETVFQQFTVLPPPNDFGDVASGAATQVLMTLDGSGSMVIPFDYRSVLPLGPGEPVARLLNGTTTLEAFPDLPGVQPINVPTSYVRSFTIDGRPLPPLLRTTVAGNQIFGATDGAVALIRVAKNGDQGVKHDLQSTRTNGGYGPIIVPNTQYAAGTSAAIPLANLHSTPDTVGFARDEQIEGNLNAGSGDIDTDDQVIQLVEVGTFNSFNTGMAASPTNNPVIGGAALAVGGGIVAFLESEEAQNNTPLNGDGDTLDHILRVFEPTGVQITPSSTLVANPFPGVDRNAMSIAGGLHVYYREAAPGLNGVASFGGGVDMVVSPDGRYLYEVYKGVFLGLLRAIHLDSETGGTQRDWTEAQSILLLNGATGITASADSRFLFIAAAGVSRLEAVEPQYLTIGTVNLQRPGNVLAQGVGGVDGLTGVGHVGTTPDGKHVYALSEVDDAIVTAAVAPGGELTYVENLKHAVDVADMADPRAVVASPDDANVYVAANGSSALHVFTRNTTTGELTSFQTLLDGGAGGPSLGGISDVAVSPDGLNVYAVSDADSAITIFSRNPATGALTFVQALTDGVGGITELTNGKSIIVSPDGTAVYATTTFGRLLVFSRTMPGGGLVFEQITGPTFGVPIATGNLAISPDSEHVYQSFDEGAMLQAYARRGNLRAFETLGGTLVAGLSGTNDATLASASTARAAFTTAGGNGPAKVYNPETDSITEIGGGIAAKKIAVSSHIIAMVVAEASLGTDGNKDGDQNDDVLVVSSVDTPEAPPKVVPIQTTDVAVTDLCLGGSNNGQPCDGDFQCPEGTCRGLAVVGATEFFYKDSGENPNPPEADFNGNGVVDMAVVLFVYDAGTNKLTNTGWQAFDFVVGGNLLAFRTDETEIFVDVSGNNNDGNVAMLVWNLGTGGIHNPRASVVKCELPGCDPGKPYKIQGSKVIFLTDEAPDLRDLDGDGLQTHVVVQVYDVGTATTQVVGDAGANGGLPAATTPLGGVPPVMPTTFIDGAVVFKQVKESEVGIDINEDGDLLDVVTIVDGDSDGDGVFDSNDTCTETPNPDQRDTDEDGLPDGCDPNAYCGAVTPAAPAVAPEPALACQKVLGKQVQKVFNTWAKSARTCLEKIAKGTLSGEPTGLCRGGMVNGVAVLPGDPRTALKITKAIGKVTTLATVKCPDPMLFDLQACANNTFEIGACVANAAAGMALLADLAYGDVGPIVDPTALRCQKAIGKASGKYFATVAKAMGTCLDKLNDGQLAGSGDTLCLGAGTTAGITLPTDPATAAKIQGAADSVTKSLTVACPGAAAAALDACGTDPTSLTDCIRCSHGRHAIAAMRAAYGPP